MRLGGTLGKERAAPRRHESNAGKERRKKGESNARKEQCQEGTSGKGKGKGKDTRVEKDHKRATLKRVEQGVKRGAGWNGVGGLRKSNARKARDLKIGLVIGRDARVEKVHKSATLKREDQGKGGRAGWNGVGGLRKATPGKREI